MRKRQFKKRLRDASNGGLIFLSFERKISERNRNLIKKEINSRFVTTTVSASEIKMLRQMLESEDIV